MAKAENTHSLAGLDSVQVKLAHTVGTWNFFAKESATAVSFALWLKQNSPIAVFCTKQINISSSIYTTAPPKADPLVMFQNAIQQILW